MVCRARRGTNDLSRAGRSPAGAWYLGRGDGRGVWWCVAGSCSRGLSAARLGRALRGSVSEAEAAALRELVEGRGDAPGAPGVKE